MRAWTVVLGIAAVGSACLTPTATTCDDGTLCNGAQVCAPLGGGCVDPAQVAACEGVAAGGVCELTGIGAGTCRDAVCVVTGCGDGVIDAGEACDDGAANGPDAPCTLECKRPTCGDGMVQGDEACDEGAANGDDRACLPTCVAAQCGDGRVRAGQELCDAGAANADDGACTTTCAVATCGDGHVWAGVEACDDGAQASGDGCRADCGKVEMCGDTFIDAGEACDDGNANIADGCDACVATAWTAAALLAGAVDALTVGLSFPQGLAVDRSGNVYFADTSNHRIRQVAPDGTISTCAGTGAAGYSGDGGPATAAMLASPAGVAVDGLGNLYVADGANHRIRKIAGDGIITTYAGTGTSGFSGDGGAATAARLASPRDVAIDGAGTLYVADAANNRIRQIGVDGTIATYAGNGGFGVSGDGGLATSAELGGPAGIAIGPASSLYVATPGSQRIRKIAPDRTITTFAGTGTGGYGGDGGEAILANLYFPYGVSVDTSGVVYIADTGNSRIRRVALDGKIATVAGTGANSFTGDGGPAVFASVFQPRAVAVDTSGQIYIADTSNKRLRRVALDGVIATLAGSGADTDGGGYGGDGGPATAAKLAEPYGIASDDAGNIYIADYRNSRIRRVTASGTISTVAGSGDTGYDGDGGPATSKRLFRPRGVAVAGDGTLYIADTGNSRIRRVDPAGEISTFAGDGSFGSAGDGGPAQAAQLGYPYGVAIDASGVVYIADTNNNRIRQVALDGTISTIAGTGVPSFGGDGGLATLAQLSSPTGVAVDNAGTVYVADTYNQRIRQFASGGIISTRAGTGTVGFGGDGGAATAATLSNPWGVAVDQAGVLFIADSNNHRIRRVQLDGTISTFAGSAGFGAAGDNGPATSAQLRAPFGVTVNAAGTVWLADGGSHRVHAVTPDGIITTVVGPIEPEGTGPLSAATLAGPVAIEIAAPFTLFAAGAFGVLQGIRPAGALLETLAGRSTYVLPAGNLARFRDATFGSVEGVAYDATIGGQGGIYLTETSASRLHLVTIVDPADPKTWTIAMLGDGALGFVDGALATARFRKPSGLLLAGRTLYVADTGNHVIRAIDLDAQTVTTIAGTPATLGYFGDDGAATDALLYAPTTMALAPDGDLFIADSGNHRIRRIAAGTGVITTVLGDGVAASSGEGAPAWTFPVNDPRGLAVDAFGNLFVTSSTAVRLLPADDDGVVDGTGAVQTIYGAAPRDTFPAFATACLTGIAVIDAETVHTTDACSGLLVELWRQPGATP